MSIRGTTCRILMFLHLHRPDCEHCANVNCGWGNEMRERLKELLEPQPQKPPNRGRTDDAA